MRNLNSLVTENICSNSRVRTSSMGSCKWQNVKKKPFLQHVTCADDRCLQPAGKSCLPKYHERRDRSGFSVAWYVQSVVGKWVRPSGSISNKPPEKKIIDIFILQKCPMWFMDTPASLWVPHRFSFTFLLFWPKLDLFQKQSGLQISRRYRCNLLG